jgi:PII-like signaling protein
VAGFEPQNVLLMAPERPMGRVRGIFCAEKLELFAQQYTEESGSVRTGSEGLRLRIFLHEMLHHGHELAYVAIVELAMREGLAGATVFRGFEGFGMHRHLHTMRLVDISDDLPMIIEIIDTTERIRRFMPLLDDYLPHGTVTISPVHILKYSAGLPA